MAILKIKDAQGNVTEVTALRGESGLKPATSVDYAPTISLAANTQTTIGTLTGDIAISLSDGVAGYANEWDVIIKQGATAYNVSLPTISWGADGAPTFAANSTTLLHFFYVGTTLCGTNRTV